MEFSTYIKGTDELSIAELLEIFKLRVSVFVVEQNCPYQEIDDQDDNAQHVFLKADNKIVAYARIIEHIDGINISFGRVLVAPNYRQHHLGHELVSAALAEIERSAPKRSIKIAAQNYLENFYQGFGFIPVSDVYLEDDIPHLDMLLTK